MVTKFSDNYSLIKKLISLFTIFELCLILIILPVVSFNFGVKINFIIKFNFKHLNVKFAFWGIVLSIFNATIVLMMNELFKVMRTLFLTCNGSIVDINVENITFNPIKYYVRNEMDCMNPFLYSSRTEGLLE